MRINYFFFVLILISTIKLVISSSGTLATEAIDVINIISNLSTNSIANKNDKTNFKKFHSIWNIIDKFESNLYVVKESIENIKQKTQNVDKFNEEKIENILYRIQFLLEKTRKLSALLNHDKRLDINLLTINMISDNVDYPKSLITQLYNLFNVRLNQFKFSNQSHESLEKEMLFKCDMNISEQHNLYSLYNDIIFREVQTSAILAFSYMWRSLYVSFDYTDEMILEIDESKKRILEYSELFKNKMNISTNFIRRCDQSEDQVKGKTYEALDDFMKVFIVNQKIFEPTDNPQCSTGCSHVPQKKRLCELQKTDCSVNNHDYDDICPGLTLGCSEIPSKSVKICRKDPDDRSSSRLYQWFKIVDKNLIHGNSDRKCNWTEEIKKSRSNRWANECKICLCHCMDNRVNTKSNNIRGFSLLWSDTSDNMVATGARIVAQDRMFHIQLREGKLLPYGKIDRTTERWIPLPKFEHVDNFPATAVYPNGARLSLERNINFATIQLIQLDNICLQKLIFDNDQLLTGARFNLDYLKNYSSIRCIALDVKYSNFQYGNGDNTVSTKYMKQLPKPTQLILNRPGNPLEFKTHHHDSKENKFITIKETDIDKDVSQTTIPFFDLLPVITDPSVPLTGIELFHKGQVDGTSGGYISLKIYPINLTMYMNP